MKTTNLSLLLICFGLIIYAHKNNAQQLASNILEKESDSIGVWIKASKNKSYPLETRKQFLLKCYQALNSSKLDTTNLRHLSTLAYLNLKLGDTILFKNKNVEVLHLAKKLKDSFTIGDAHWNFASYYNKIHTYDSAYHHFNLAQKHFEKKGYLYEAAKTQYGMALIKGRFFDYSGSEVLVTKAIKKYKLINDNKSLYSCYTYLASLQNDIYEYEKSLFYLNKASVYLKEFKPKNNSLKEINLNNIGSTYLKMGDYDSALKYFDKILTNNQLKKNNPNRYSRVITNKAYCKLLMKDTLNVEKSLKEALNIKDSLKDKEGVLTNKIYLSKYYSYAKDTIKAVKHAKDANTIAKKIKNGRNYLESLMLLAKLEPEKAVSYLEKHIKYNDSLQIVDRKTLNKFTRIAYETDEYIEENKNLTERIVWITIISSSLVLILALLYFVKRQKVKNQKLIFDNAERKANEQLYLLTIKQQDKLEDEKTKERSRIAKELHDGILGKIYGTRLGLGLLDIKTDNETKKEYLSFLEELQVIEKEIRDVSHKLSNNAETSMIGFTNTITQLIKNKQKVGNFKSKLEFDNKIDWDKIDEVIKVNLYRIIQESIVNSIKHASANNILIQFKLVEKEILLLTIKDDGIGFNSRKKIKGIGLKHMKSRTEKLNGVFRIHSKLNKGTIITIKIPV